MILIDYLVVLFALIVLVFMSAIYLIRAAGRTRLELKVSPFFGIQLAPFLALWVLNFLYGKDAARPNSRIANSVIRVL
jgi:hypothetical protein